MPDSKDTSLWEFPAKPSRPTRGRRPRLAITSLSLSVFLIAGIFFNPLWRHSHSYHAPCAPLDNNSIEARVNRILSQTPLIDGHDDFAILIRGLVNNHINTDSFRSDFEGGTLPYHVDLPRLRAGKNGGAFWSVFVPCPANGSDFSDENYSKSVRETLEQIDVITRLAAAYPDDFSSVNINSSTALAAFEQGKFISPLGVEGLHQIGNSVANLRHYYGLGVRYATLTHNCHNRFADAAILEHPARKAEPLWHGVSTEGRRVIREMNRLGMIIDLSHVSEDTMVDVLGGKDNDWDGSLAPVIFSHSSAFSLCPHPRNVKDHVLEMVRDRDSVVMVNFYPGFISCVDVDAENGLPGPDPDHEATLERVADHILHIAGLVGFDHVGLGSDFDGIDATPKGLEDVSKFPDLVAELLRRGVSDEEAAKIVGGNVLRVWRNVDAIAQKMQAEGELPVEDEPSPM